jgi:hypothetical protein
MNPIASLSVDPMPEPRGESPASGVTGDASSAEFGLALALAAAAQSQAAAPVAPTAGPAPAPAGGFPEPPVADAIPALAENVVLTDVPVAVPRPTPSSRAPLPEVAAGTARSPIAPPPARPAAVGRDGTLLPAAPQPPEARSPQPPPMTAATTVRSPVAPLPARPADSGLEGTPLPAAPAQPETIRPLVGPVGSAGAPATPVTAEAAATVRDASSRTAELPLTIRVLELVRGMTEQAARVALDTAMSAGLAQGAPLEAAPQSGRGRSMPWQAAQVPGASAAESRQALATRVLEALPGLGGLDRGRSASRTQPRLASEAVTPGEAPQPNEGWSARGAVPPRASVPADPPLPAPRSDVRLPSAVPAQIAPAPEAGERGRARPGERARDGEGPTRPAGDMLAEASATARASLADESLPASAGPGAPLPQGVRSAAAPTDPSVGATRAATVPLEARTAARPGDQITLQFSGEDGLEGQLRVAVRGQNVRATILADDPVSAERFARGVDGLQRALLDRGFAEARVNVQQTARSEGSASGNSPRDGNQGDSQPRGEGRDRYSSSRQERDSASPEDRPDRRPSRQRAER